MHTANEASDAASLISRAGVVARATSPAELRTVDRPAAGLSRLLRQLAHRLIDPMPLRVHLTRQIIELLQLGSYRERLVLDLVPRPHYGFCVYHAALLAAMLGHRRISVIEFGVAGGNGLVNLEEHGCEVERVTGVACEIYGFDTGRGLPPPTDWRDLPYLWKEGFYDCDVERLRQRLSTAQLVLGDVAETVKDFVARNPAPIGAVMVDLDLYSSTAAALKMFQDPSVNCLPRVFFYLDDITGEPLQAYNEYTGELLAIREFNEASPQRKFARLDLGARRRFRADWNDRNLCPPQFRPPGLCGLCRARG